MNCLLLITLLLIAAVAAQEQPLTPTLPSAGPPLGPSTIVAKNAKKAREVAGTATDKGAKHAVKKADKVLGADAQALENFRKITERLAQNKEAAELAAENAKKAAELAARNAKEAAELAARNAAEAAEMTARKADKAAKPQVLETFQEISQRLAQEQKAAELAGTNTGLHAIPRDLETFQQITQRLAREEKAAELAAKNADAAAGAAKGLGRTKIGLLVGGAGIATVGAVAAIKHLLGGNRGQDALPAAVVERRFRH